MTETSHCGYWLECSEKYARASRGERYRCANGVGPDWFPRWLRWFLGLTWFLFGISILPCADIHDFDFEYAESEDEIREANDRMGRNLVRLVQQTPRRKSRLIQWILRLAPVVWVLGLLPAAIRVNADFLHEILVRYARMIRIATITLALDYGGVKSWKKHEATKASRIMQDITVGQQ